VKKNKFSRALKHLKSKKLDEKIKKLDEAAPTNNMSGVYQQSPRSGAGFRLGPPDPARTFVAAADGSWPAGIPGTAGEPYYTRPPDHWTGTVDWETITTPEFGFDSAQGNNTDGLIDPVTNVVKTQLPPGSRGFILGPLVDGFVPNHIHDAFTRIGYIEKDTRQFVLLGIIQGEWIGGLNDAASPGSYPVWDGSSGKFTASNPNFTLDMALWFRNEMLKNRFVKNVSYNAVGGIPQQGNPDPNAPQSLGGNGVGGGSGAAGGNPDGTGTGYGSGGNPDIGTPQGAPDPGKDPGGNNLWGLLSDLAKKGKDLISKFGDFAMDPFGSIADFVKNDVVDLYDKFSDTTLSNDVLEPAFEKFGQILGSKKGALLGILTTAASDIRAFVGDKYSDFGDKPAFSSSNNQFSYAANLAMSLAQSIGNGRPVVMDNSVVSSSTIAQNMSVNDINMMFDSNSDILNGPPNIASDPDSILNPNKDGDNKKPYMGDGFGGEGGSIMTPFTDGKGNYFIMNVADKTLRVGGESGEKFDFNTQTFTDIPSGGNATSIVNDMVNSGQFADGLTSILNQQTDDANYNTNLVNNLTDTVKNSDTFNNLMTVLDNDTVGGSFVSGYSTGTVNGAAGGALLYNQIKVKLGLMEPSDLQNAGGYGHVSRQTVINVNDLDPEVKAEFFKKYNIQESYLASSRDKKRILREIRQPLKEIKELPKTTKLKGYKPNFKGKYSPQNTPDVTASKRSDQLVMAKNAEGQAWTVGDKYHKGWETTGRMNHVYARVGESDKYFEQITSNNNTDVERKMQEHLNHVYHNKAMLKIDSNYKSPFTDNIDEQETFDNKINDPLFTKVAKRLKKEIDYEKKPAKAGYPNEAPPKIDPNTGMHPKFGKRYKYDKLDPHSAKTMAGAPTGDPEIDANVKKAAKIKENWRSDLKNLWLGSEREEWKKKLEEGMTTTDTFSYSIPGRGDDILHKKQTGFTGDGDINDFDHSTGIHNGGEFTGMTSFTDHDNVDDPHDLGKLVRSYSGFDSRGHRVVPTSGDGFNGTSDGSSDFWPGKSGGFRGVTFRGSYNSFPYTAIGGPTDENHPIEPVDVNSNETKLNYTTPEPSERMSDRVGSCLFVGGGPGSPGVPRLAAFKAVDTTEMDTLSLNWFTTGLIYTSGSGDDRQTHTRDSTRFSQPGDDIFIYYWAGDKEGAKSFANPSSTYGGKSHDGWRPLHINPQGVADFNYSSIIIPHKAMKDGGGSFRGPSTEWAGYRGNTFYNSKLTLPPWARDASTRFMIVQNQISTGTAYAVWGITSLNFQRQQAMSVGVPLDDPQAVSFIRTGNPNMTAKERKKKVIEMLRASRAYTTQKYGKDFPYRTQLEPEKESRYTPAELQADIKRRQAINRRQKQLAAQARKFRSTGRVGGSRSRGFRGYLRTGRDSKGMTTRARVNPKDIIGSI